jgi:hypothetical protein
MARSREITGVVAAIVFGVAAWLFGVTTLTGALAQTPSARLLSSNQTTTLDCAGGGALIAGSNNKLTLTGGCNMLRVLGAYNTITAALATNAHILFVGSNNAVTWTSSDGKEPTVRYLGSNNTLTRAH